MFRIILLGPAGSGKGTQGSLISQRYGIPVISTGCLLREKIKAGDELGKQINYTISAGNCVSNDLIFDILGERLKKNDCKKGFILDGFPRNVEQAIELENRFLKDSNVDAVLVFDIPRDIVFKRTSGRFECNVCKRMYNKFFNDTKVKGVCDNCGSTDFFIRSDDANLDAINRRLDIYERMSNEITAFYDNKNIIYHINALGSINEINQSILEVLENLNIN